MTLTPQEIDEEIFKRDSLDALARALAYSARKRAEERAKVRSFQVREPRFRPISDRAGRSETTSFHADERPPITRRLNELRTEGVEPDPSHPRRKLYLYGGAWRTIEELAARSSVTINTLRHRLRYGNMTISQAVDTPMIPASTPRRGRGRSQLSTFS